MRSVTIAVIALIFGAGGGFAQSAWEIRDKNTGKAVHYYDGARQDFGGPWGDSARFSHVAVSPRPRVSEPAGGAISTGMLMPFLATVVPPGWLECDGKTIGNSASGATSRANDDTRALFIAIWESQPTALIQDNGGNPTGRGASASADFLAGKRISLPAEAAFPASGGFRMRYVVRL